jgi:hypothetical protein
MDTRLINFRIPTKLADELKLIALLKKKTMQEIVIPMIEKYVRENQS